MTEYNVIEAFQIENGKMNSSKVIEFFLIVEQLFCLDV